MQSDSASMMKLDNSTLCFWQAEHMSHALVTAAFMEAVMASYDRHGHCEASCRSQANSECTHMEPNVPRTKASLSRLMMRLGVLIWLTCHHHAGSSIRNQQSCHGIHVTLAVHEMMSARHEGHPVGQAIWLM